MTIESVIREQRTVIEGLWWQSAREWCGGARDEQAVLVRRLGERLVALCDALEHQAITAPALPEEPTKEVAHLGSLSPQVIWEYALIERCVYQAWAMARGGWPPESEKDSGCAMRFRPRTRGHRADLRRDDV